MEPATQAATTIQAHWRGYRARIEFKAQQGAASTIHDHVGRFLARRQAAKDEEQQQRAARFKAVMARHSDRIKALEHEKRLIKGLPLEELQALQARREAAAATIQATWRGAQQRQQLRATMPAFGGLRPITCSSPTLPDDPSGFLPACRSSRNWLRQSAAQQQPAPTGPNLIRTLRQQQLQQENSALSAHYSGAAAAEAADAAAGGRLASSVSQPLLPCAEESSWLSAEGSKLSATGGLLQEASAYGQRRAAIPAANRAMLDRQIKTRADAVSADPGTLRAVRDRQQQVDQRLQQLLQEHRSSEGKRLQAVRRRQRLLQKSEVLHGHLKQLPGGLDALDADSSSACCWPAQQSLLRPGSIRSERAQQAHALSLGEARVQSKWWAPLKQLNQMYGALATAAARGGGARGGEGRLIQGHRTQAADAAGFLRMQRDWEQEEIAWRGSWAAIGEREAQRV